MPCTLHSSRYGLGVVNFKQERYPLAEYHFREALTIAPHNPILLTLVGKVVQKSPDRLEEALEIYEKAHKLAPHHTHFAFQKAQVLVELQEYAVAEDILKDLIETTNCDSNVYFLLGQVYQGLGRRKDACGAYILAQDLSTHKSISKIRDALDKLVQIDNNNTSIFYPFALARLLARRGLKIPW